MIWLVAIISGFALGLAYFGALWLMARRVTSRPVSRILLSVSGPARLALLALAFYALSGQRAGKLLSALAGLWLARGYLIWKLGDARHGS